MTTINAITRADVESFRAGDGSMDMYQRIATKSAIYPGQGTPLGLVYVALKGCGEAGEFAEHVGKAMRDDNLIQQFPAKGEEKRPSGFVDTFAYASYPMTPERRSKLIKEIGDKLWYLAAMCNELGITLSEVALINLEKLCDRTERDALRGSGDDR